MTTDYTRVVDQDPEETADEERAPALNSKYEAEIRALIGAAEDEEALYPESEVRSRALDQVLRVQRDLDLLERAALEADEFEREHIFQLRRERKEAVTVDVEIDALVLFTRYLREAGVPLSLYLHEEPRLWSAINYALVERFRRWEIWRRGYAIKTVNNHLAIIKLYARIAHTARFMSAEQFLPISHISTIRGAEARRIDEKRERMGIQTRFKDKKKANPTFLSPQELRALLARPRTPQGLRDLVAILLMWDLSLRPNEALTLRLVDLDLEDGTVFVDRHKTNENQTHEFTPRLRAALDAYLAVRKDRRPDAPLLVRSLKSEQLVELMPVDKEDEDSLLWTPRLSVQGLGKRMRTLGHLLSEELGREIDLTSYDGRHGFVRQGIDAGIDPMRIKLAGNWKGTSMVERYYGKKKIANKGIVFE